MSIRFLSLRRTKGRDFVTDCKYRKIYKQIEKNVKLSIIMLNNKTRLTSEQTKRCNHVLALFEEPTNFLEPGGEIIILGMTNIWNLGSRKYNTKIIGQKTKFT